MPNIVILYHFTLCKDKKRNIISACQVYIYSTTHLMTSLVCISIRNQLHLQDHIHLSRFQSKVHITMALTAPRLSQEAKDLHPKACCTPQDNMWRLSAVTWPILHRPAHTLQDLENLLLWPTQDYNHNLYHAVCDIKKM